MGATVSRSDFTYSYSDEPHATRRKLILKKYPQVKKLMGVDAAFKWQVLALVLVQLASFYLLRNVTNFWILFLTAYFFGGVANHAIMLAIHEISHGMAFGPSRPLANKLFGMFANLPIGVPMSISFKKYHLEHHRYQGDDKLDTDLPTRVEAMLFTNTLRKAIWCILQPFFYTLRPLVINPKPLDKLELLNIVLQVSFNLVVGHMLGWRIIAYMIGGSVLAMGLHPVAGHFISEHTLMFDYEEPEERCKREALVKLDTNNNLACLPDKSAGEVFKGSLMKDRSGEKSSVNISNHNIATCQDAVDGDGKFLVPETCSYYGPLNWVTFNVGYHVEHHDFPSIPGSRLHMLSKIAPEYYLNLNYHTSWTNVLWRYITDPKISPAARVRRPHSIKYNKQSE